eukprot:Awhi_evm1s15056
MKSQKIFHFHKNDLLSKQPSNSSNNINNGRSTGDNTNHSRPNSPGKGGLSHSTPSSPSLASFPHSLSQSNPPEHSGISGETNSTSSAYPYSGSRSYHQPTIYSEDGKGVWVSNDNYTMVDNDSSTQRARMGAVGDDVNTSLSSSAMDFNRDSVNNYRRLYGDSRYGPRRQSTEKGGDSEGGRVSSKRSDVGNFDNGQAGNRDDNMKHEPDYQSKRFDYDSSVRSSFNNNNNNNNNINRMTMFRHGSSSSNVHMDNSSSLPTSPMFPHDYDRNRDYDYEYEHGHDGDRERIRSRGRPRGLPLHPYHHHHPPPPHHHRHRYPPSHSHPHSQYRHHHHHPYYPPSHSPVLYEDNNVMDDHHDGDYDDAMLNPSYPLHPPPPRNQRYYSPNNYPSHPSSSDIPESYLPHSQQRFYPPLKSPNPSQSQHGSVAMPSSPTAAKRKRGRPRHSTSTGGGPSSSMSSSLPSSLPASPSMRSAYMPHETYHNRDNPNSPYFEDENSYYHDKQSGNHEQNAGNKRTLPPASHPSRLGNHSRKVDRSSQPSPFQYFFPSSESPSPSLTSYNNKSYDNNNTNNNNSDKNNKDNYNNNNNNKNNINKNNNNDNNNSNANNDNNNYDNSNNNNDNYNNDDHNNSNDNNNNNNSNFSATRPKSKARFPESKTMRGTPQQEAMMSTMFIPSSAPSTPTPPVSEKALREDSAKSSNAQLNNDLAKEGMV